MDAMRVLEQLGGVRSIASELGLSEGQARSGAAALLPAILGGFKKQATEQPTGLEGLGGLLGQLGGGGLLDSLLGQEPTDVGRGNDVLGQIFGSKDVSRAVASNAAANTGLDVRLLKQMLPMLAMAVAGLMATGGSEAASRPPQPADGLGGVLGELLAGAGGGSASGLASMLDLDGDGNPLDDILKMIGR
jgi:hypothetical protein